MGVDQNLDPEFIDIAVNFFSGGQPSPLRYSKKTGKANRKGWKYDMKADRKRELDTSE